ENGPSPAPARGLQPAFQKERPDERMLQAWTALPVAAMWQKLAHLIGQSLAPEYLQRSRSGTRSPCGGVRQSLYPWRYRIAGYNATSMSEMPPTASYTALFHAAGRFVSTLPSVQEIR